MEFDFAEHGFCIFKNRLDRFHMGQVLETFRIFLNGDKLSAIDDLILLREAESHELIYKASIACGSSVAAYKMLGSTFLMEEVADITGSKYTSLHMMPLHIQVQLPSDERFDYRWHQESSFYPNYKSVVSIWFPILRATSIESGTMSVIPGSHKGGCRQAKKYFSHDKFMQIEPDVTIEEEESSVPIEIEPGDVCVFDDHLVHKSIKNSSNLPRINGIIRVIDMDRQEKINPLYKAVGYES